MQNKSLLLFGMASAVAVLSCGKKDSASTDEVTDVITNALAIGYPDGLSIPTFPQTTSASALVGDGTLYLEENDTKGQTLKQKREDAKEILNGKVEDCFQNMKKRLRLNFLQGQEKCYEFDQDMIYGYRGDLTKLAGTTSGLSTKQGSTEVCMVSFAREQMKEIEQIIDQQLDRAQAMACIAKKNGRELPAAAGGELDITEDMKNKRPTDGIAPQFESVKLKRLADNDGKPVFETTVQSKIGTASEKLTIIHRPESATDNSSYNGVISIQRSGDQNRDKGKTMLVSVEYSRSGDNVKASVRRARFASSLTPVFDDGGRVNFAAVPQNADNQTVEGISLVEFDMNPNDSTGTLSYWKNPGGNYNESARGFVFKVEKDGEFNKGCAMTGAARDLSIRKALSESTVLKPSGWYHPFFNGTTAAGVPEYDYQKTENGQNAKWKKPAIDGPVATAFVTQQIGDSVSRQCFKQDSSGNYGLDADAGIAGSAGYELITTSDAKFIAPPDVTSIKGRTFKQ